MTDSTRRSPRAAVGTPAVDAESRSDEILAFWFGAPGDEDYGERRPFWFRGPAELDLEIRERFLADYDTATAGTYDGLRASALGTLTLILLFDQFPRNMFRGTARAYASDAKALALANDALERGFDRGLLVSQRMFMYLPFEHSENLEDQRRAAGLILPIAEGYEGGERSIKAVERHLEIIERFGRFPHRNAALGRDTTPAEAEFLKEPDSSF